MIQKLAANPTITMDNTYRQIITKIVKVHDLYRNRADDLSESKRNRKGNKSDNNQEKEFIHKIADLETALQRIAADMEKSPALKSDKQYVRITKLCAQDIQTIARRRQAMFKINKNLLDLARETEQLTVQIQKDLKSAGETAFLCCGNDGAKKFKMTMQRFNICARQWSIISSLEAKDSVENFISPDYDEKNFAFIRQILEKNWPKQPEKPKEITKVQYKEREVVKYVNTGEPSKLAIANQYIYGVNHEPNVAYGLKIYHEQAKKDDAKAAAFLGQAYQEGMLLPKDIEKAINYYQIALKTKDPHGSYRYALALIQGTFSDKQNKADMESAYKILSQIAESSNPSAEALVQLGELYEEGKFRSDSEGIYKVQPDLKKAINFYKKAKQLHLPRASNNLGVLYINNRLFSENNPNSSVKNEDNIADNLKKGKKLLEEAMLQGFSQAFYNLGCLYESGSLGRKDQEQALLYFYNGGLKGDHHSRLRFAYQLMNQTSIMKEQYEQHYRIAFRWLQSIVHHLSIEQASKLESYPGNSSVQKSYLSKYPHSHPLSRPSENYFDGIKTSVAIKAEALFYMGLMYEFGFGVDSSPKKAYSYFLQSANLQYPAAKTKIGDCYFSGFGIQEKRQLAIGCYIEASEAGNTDAMVNLGTIYLNGIPSLVEVNYQKAHQYFIKAAEFENSDSMVHLSYMYRAGLGCEKDPQMAKTLLERAASKKNSHALYLLKEMGETFDDRILFHNLDNQFFTVPKKIDTKQIVPVCSKIPIN